MPCVGSTARSLLSLLVFITLYGADQGRVDKAKQRQDATPAYKSSHGTSVSPTTVSKSPRPCIEQSTKAVPDFLKPHHHDGFESSADQPAHPEDRAQQAPESSQLLRRLQPRHDDACPMSHPACLEADSLKLVAADNASDRDSDTDDEPEVQRCF